MTCPRCHAETFAGMRFCGQLTCPRYKAPQKRQSSTASRRSEPGDLVWRSATWHPSGGYALASRAGLDAQSKVDQVSGKSPSDFRSARMS